MREAVYPGLGLAYIEPELREDRGEIETARAGHLAQLVELGDLRGDLQVHTRASDGREASDVLKTRRLADLKKWLLR
jgi:DNA polymerase (family X)